jgi:hypothetical protein
MTLLLDASLPLTPINITEGLHGPQRTEWVAALDHEMDRLRECNTFEVCSNVDKSMINLRVTRNTMYRSSIDAV